MSGGDIRRGFGPVCLLSPAPLARPTCLFLRDAAKREGQARRRASPGQPLPPSHLPPELEPAPASVTSAEVAAEMGARRVARCAHPPPIPLNPPEASLAFPNRNGDVIFPGPLNP